MDELSDDQVLSGGSGGYIYIQQLGNPNPNSTLYNVFQGEIKANGGYAIGDSTYGGSGGRIVFDFHNASDD